MNIDPVNIKSISFVADILGQRKTVSWDRGVLSIEGVDHYADVLDLIGKLQSVGATVFSTDSGLVTKSAVLPPTTVVVSAPVVTQVVKTVVPPAPKEQPKTDDDDSVFSKMESIKDVVKEMTRRGHGDMASVITAVTELADSGMCPMLVRLGDQLPERLTAVCNTLRLPGSVTAG